MGRFLSLSLPLLVGMMGLFALWLAWGLAPSTAELARLGLERSEPLPLHIAAGGWVIESLALTALFLLIQGRSGGWLLDGLVTGLIGWIFRGPLMVLSLVGMSRLGADPWWPMALRWLLLYLACGVALSIVARRVGLRR